MTLYQISTQDGGKKDLTLNLGALAELSKHNKPLCDRYFALYKKLQRQDEMNELEQAEIIYIAYAAAHPNEDVEPLEEFLYDLTDSREEIGDTFQKLFGVQEKKQNSQRPSKKRHGK